MIEIEPHSRTIRITRTSSKYYKRAKKVEKVEENWLVFLTKGYFGERTKVAGFPGHVQQGLNKTCSCLRRHPRVDLSMRPCSYVPQADIL